MADAEAGKSRRTLDKLLRVGWHERVDWAAVKSRLRSHPHEVAQESGCLPFPLHRALSRGRSGDAPPPAVIQALLNANEGAAKATVRGGRTPLHTSCFCQCGADVVGMVLEAFPEAAEMKDSCGAIPLHIASWRKDAEVVRLLIRARPEVVGMRDKCELLPLHWAAGSSYATPAIIRLLLEEGIRHGVEDGSGGATVKDDWGKTPLDKACEDINGDEVSDEPWEKVVMLARAATSTTTGMTDDRCVDTTPLSVRAMLPALHAVVKAGCSDRIVRHSILIGSPGACLERDHCGQTALAVAASMTEPDLKVVEFLLSDGCSGTDTARMADNEGRLPLHLAAGSGWLYEGRLNILLEAEPRALVMQDTVTRLYPFMLAAAGPSSNVDSAFRLLRADPSFI